MTVTVPESGHVEFDLPRDLATPGEAEIIVLFEPRSPAAPRPGSREAILAMEPAIEAWRAANPDKLMSGGELAPERTDVPVEDLPRGHWRRVQAVLAELDKVDRPRMTAEEVDAYIAEERASWGDDP